VVFSIFKIDITQKKKVGINYKDKECKKRRQQQKTDVNKILSSGDR